MTQPSNVRFVMEDRLLQDLNNFQDLVNADQTAFEDSVNAKIAGFSGYNFAINGAMDVWQRGVGLFSNTGYCADRWKIDSRVATAVGQYVQPAEAYYASGTVSGKYAMEIYSTNATNSIQVSQYFESNYVNALRGNQVTFSFMAKCRDSTAPEISMGVDISDTADSSTATFTQIGTSTYSTLNSVWYRYEHTVNIPFDITSAGLRIRFGFNNIALDEHIQITDVKFEIGATATSFTRNGGNLAGERVACQRYYQRINGTSAGAVAHGGAGTTTSATVLIPLKTTMRVTPTAIDYPTPIATYFGFYNWAGAGGSAASALALGGSSNPDVAQVSGTIAGATANAAMYMRFAGNTTYLGFSAEL